LRVIELDDSFVDSMHRRYDRKDFATEHTGLATEHTEL
jgi:hypothetical protein